MENGVSMSISKIPDHKNPEFDICKYVKLFNGVPCPLAKRENTEGEYSSVGGRMFKDTDREIANSRNNNVKTRC